MKKTIVLFCMCTMIQLSCNIWAVEISKDEMRVNYAEALSSYEKGNYGTAKNLLEKNLAAGDNREYIYFMLGKIYRNDPFFDSTKAIEFFERYISLTKDKKKKNIGRLQLAYIYKDIDLKKAKEYVDLMISDYPDDADMKFCYAVIYNRLGIEYYIKNLYDDALKCFREVLSKRKDFQEAYNNSAIVIFRLIEIATDNVTKHELCEKAKQLLLESKKLNENNEKLNNNITYFERICKTKLE